MDGANHHEQAKSLADEHKTHLEVMKNEPHENTFASHLARGFLQRAEKELHELANLTHDRDALNVIAETGSAASSLARSKLNNLDPHMVMSPLTPSTQVESRQSKLKTLQQAAQVRYDAEMADKKERGRKAFGNLLRPTRAATDSQEGTAKPDDEIAKRKARFAAIMRKDA